MALFDRSTLAPLSLVGLGPAAQEPPEVDERAELLARWRRREAELEAVEKEVRATDQMLAAARRRDAENLAERRRAAGGGPGAEHERALLDAIERRRAWRLAHPEIRMRVRAEIEAETRRREREDDR